MSTPATVRLLAQEFASLSDSVIQGYLDLAATSVNASAFGARAGKAQALLAAHYLKVSSSNGMGSISQEDNGAISRSYSDNAIGEEPISSTSYGRMYLSVQKGNIVSPIVV